MDWGKTKCAALVMTSPPPTPLPLSSGFSFIKWALGFRNLAGSAETRSGAVSLFLSKDLCPKLLLFLILCLVTYLGSVSGNWQDYILLEIRETRQELLAEVLLVFSWYDCDDKLNSGELFIHVKIDIFAPDWFRFGYLGNHIYLQPIVWLVVSMWIVSTGLMMSSIPFVLDYQS